ncbi:MAG: ribose ABC transporter permease [Actinobacteria bacterium 13_1_20CM_2_65_11]|nr:MAG: ribose ABC transporter permease [Chloroflexi bacterium 13_1_40CM_65_17]OLC66043.1 MAG: ribose ABC transporter permease [Actinobacteria bacterium 13_1_40CM_4_65_12]OLD23499.1 MAG: ribose ABC transporter permease [Chloroflexi bacterium 13_1_40CM_3_65_12]OLD49373.1 MAG: ribose ABC transporter permease [Actinobacteria bacterium 13_1_40CM_2_65_8]OLE81470.1 MAG: ribose ABC transporter permease [Actinobacteria bacterium 13_1_20CM_2_65_11]
MSVASQPVPAPAPSAKEAGADERTGGVRLIVRLLQRPELGALLGAMAVYALFATVDATPGHRFSSIAGMQNWTDVASSYGIMAVAVALLMIGGEFDLSAGVMTGTSGLLLGMMITRYQLNVWVGIVVVLVFAAVIGAMNGLLVIRTKLPSFIITLATFFVLRGVDVGVTKLLTNTVRFDVSDHAPGFASAQAILGSTFLAPYNFQDAVLWWIAITIIATWVLTQTTFGNWIFAVGGDANAARAVGVPVVRTKIILFMVTAMSAGLVGIMVALRFKGIQSGQGVGQEFFYIIAAVVGGCLLTGGYGSAIGASIGALIIGFAQIGIIFAGWESDWYYTFLGVILFLAVGVNTVVRRRASSARR